MTDRRPIQFGLLILVVALTLASPAFAAKKSAGLKGQNISIQDGMTESGQKADISLRKANSGNSKNQNAPSNGRK